VTNYNLRPSVELKDFQVVGVNYGLAHHYCIIADDPGIGKTIESLAVCTKTKLKTLVVCPAYLKDTWLAEVIKFTTLRVEVVRDPKTFAPKYDTDIIISSYSQLKHTRQLFSWARMVIADEIHYCKSITAERSLLFHEYVQGAAPERLLLLSGTPIKNRIGEYFSLLILASYNPRKTSGRRLFDPKRVHIGQGKKVTKYEGARNIPLLKTFLQGKFIRRLAKDVLNLKESILKDVYISFESDPDLKELWEEFVNNPKGGHISTRKANSAYKKSVFTCRYVEDLVEVEGSCVIFTDHLRSAHYIYKHFGKKARLIDGGVPSDLRSKYVKEFQEAKYPILVATIGAASTGFTLTRTNNMVFNDISFVGANNEQAMKRINRIGQEKTCVYHFILGSREDKLINKTVMKKEKDLRRIYDED